MSGLSPHATPPESGTETPSPFMMGVQPGDEDDARWDKAIEDVFGKRPEAPEDTDQEPGSGGGGVPDPETPSPDDEPGGEEAEGEEVPPTDPSTSTPPANSPSGEAGEGGEVDAGATGDVDLVALFEARTGAKPTEADVLGLVELAEWAAGLTPEQQQAVNAALANPNTYTQQTYQPPAPPAPPVDDIYEKYADDPDLAPLVERMRWLESNVTNLSSQQVGNAQQQIHNGLIKGSDEFKAAYSISDVELQALQGAVARTGILPGMVSAYQDPAIAMNKALEFTFMQTPSLRDRWMDQQFAVRQEREKAHEARKNRASSVTGTGANGASRTAPPPQTPDQHWGAVAAGIREALSNGQGT